MMLTLTRIKTFTLYFETEEPDCSSHLEGLHPLLLLDELNPVVRLLYNILLLVFVYHARLVQELTIATEHLQQRGSQCYISDRVREK